MFEITVESDFSAAHAISILGIREPIHGHDWHVTAVIQGTQLDNDGLLVDFHTIESALAQITSEYHNTNLNDHPDYESINASAEHVAMTIANKLSAAIGAALAQHARLTTLTVSEAPRCNATYHLPANNPA